jgi:phytoene synthase
MAGMGKPKKHGSGVLRSNFLFGILFLPAAHREAVRAIYAFCRAADDAADLDPKNGGAGIAHWREEVASCYAGAPRDPVMKKLHPYVRRLKLKREYFDKILQGMEMDLKLRRYATMEELEEYCDCVAGAVGLLCLQVFGLHDDPRVHEYSVNLSRGLQLTNILRDLGEDVLLDRVYIPREDLAAFDYSEKDLKAGVINMGFFNVARLTAGRVRGYFDRADRAIDADLRKKLIGPEIMRETYQALLGKMTKALDLILDRKPPRISLLEKLIIAVATWIEIKIA